MLPLAYFRIHVLAYAYTWHYVWASSPNKTGEPRSSIKYPSTIFPKATSTIQHILLKSKGNKLQEKDMSSAWALQRLSGLYYSWNPQAQRYNWSQRFENYSASKLQALRQRKPQHELQLIITYAPIPNNLNDPYMQDMLSWGVSEGNTISTASSYNGGWEKWAQFQTFQFLTQHAGH
jgi:hypothetical protein